MRKNILIIAFLFFGTTTLLVANEKAYDSSGLLDMYYKKGLEAGAKSGYEKGYEDGLELAKKMLIKRQKNEK